MRFRLRTLLIILALGPPALAWLCWPVLVTQYNAWQWRRAVATAVPAVARRLVRQAELLAVVSESWDQSALDAIHELSEIGDANALPLLEKKSQTPRVLDGKFFLTLEHTIARIKERTETKE